MRMTCRWVLALFCAAAWGADDAPRSKLTLWYDKPATKWMQEALPIGNGSMGAMLFGGVDEERMQFNEESLWIGNEDDTGAFQNFGDVYVTLGDMDGVSNPSANPTPAGESVEASCDGNPGTKWCFEHHGRFPVVWQAALRMAGARPVTNYTLTSADDVPGRDPRDWRFLGSQDGERWTLLDERKNEPVWTDRRTPKRFNIINDKVWRYYRFEFLAVHDAPHFQLAEIALGGGSGPVQSDVREYVHDLRVETAVQQTAYKKGGVGFMRSAFASHPAGVIVLHFDADRPGQYTGSVRMKDAHGARTVAEGHALLIAGAFAAYEYDGGRTWPPLHREAQVRVLNKGGRVSARDGAIAFEGADSITLLLSAGTDFLQDRARNWRGAMPHDAVTRRLDEAEKKGFGALLDEHVRDYGALFRRCSLDLGGSDDGKRSTAERLRAYRVDAPDLGLEELLFQYGRYLMIASSRKGGLPANLQGKWNDSNKPPWRSDYHTDVNVQMNYWMADPANLAECFTPYADWIHSIRAVRMDATRKAFKTRGWTMRGESGLFGGSTWDWIPGTSAWLLQNSYDHYRFSGDTEYLRNRAYPAMKEVCEFWLDQLKALPDGTLVSPNGYSPEHGPKEDGVSFDQQLVWDLFTSTIEACDILNVDRAFRDLLAEKRAKLLGPRIGRWGQLQEWMTDRDNPKDTHRHLSHLIAVHPGRQISPLTTPELAAAARVSLAARGDDGTGWSTAWKINQWARLHDGDHAHRMFGNLFRLVSNAGIDMGHGGGLYANLLDAHPPFQIDGNFGYVAGVCEMLAQSHTDVIVLLPALPRVWSSGTARGLRARTGVVLEELVWKDGRLERCVFRDATGRDRNLAVIVGGRKQIVRLGAHATASIGPAP